MLRNVRRFQRAHHMTVDGVVGSGTSRALRTIAARRAHAQEHAARGMPTVGATRLRAEIIQHSVVPAVVSWNEPIDSARVVDAATRVAGCPDRLRDAGERHHHRCGQEQPPGTPKRSKGHRPAVSHRVRGRPVKAWRLRQDRRPACDKVMPPSQIAETMPPPAPGPLASPGVKGSLLTEAQLALLRAYLAELAG